MQDKRLNIISWISPFIFALLGCDKDDWDGYEQVRIVSSADAKLQYAYARRSNDAKPKPLVVSLHMWTGSFSSPDPLARLVAEEDWHYIHPDFRGPNVTPESCASQVALSDIDDAIAYCLSTWNVDVERIYVIGASGGGHAACAYFLNAKYPIRATYAWVPIVDIGAWYRQCSQRSLDYAEHIERICGGTFDPLIAKARSPLHMPVPDTLSGRIHLYTGIDDGYNGSVPVSHSLQMFNRLCHISGEPERAIASTEMLSLVTKDVFPVGQFLDTGRDLFLERRCEIASLTIFEGGHEILPDQAMSFILQDSIQ